MVLIIFYFQISLLNHSRGIQGFKTCKLPSDGGICSTNYLIKYVEERYLSLFVSEMFESLP